MIKHPGEIERLRLAAHFAEAGTAAAIAHIRPGCTADELFSVFRTAAVGRAAELGFKGTVLPNGAITIGPVATGKGRAAERGDVIRLDLGCIVDGYTSDCARKAVLAQPNADQRAIYGALHNAFEAGLERLRPGVSLRDVHVAAMKAMHDRGFDSVLPRPFWSRCRSVDFRRGMAVHCGGGRDHDRSGYGAGL
jgi:Xaa-Pro aminopeptidase